MASHHKTSRAPWLKLPIYVPEVGSTFCNSACAVQYELNQYCISSQLLFGLCYPFNGPANHRMIMPSIHKKQLFYMIVIDGKHILPGRSYMFSEKIN
jgi:hypothetical protein